MVGKETRSGPDPIINQNFVVKLKTSWINHSTMTNDIDLMVVQQIQG